MSEERVKLVLWYSSFSRKRSKKLLFCFAEGFWAQTSAKRTQGVWGRAPAKRYVKWKKKQKALYFTEG
jgi:hypothetical protein